MWPGIRVGQWLAILLGPLMSRPSVVVVEQGGTMKLLAVCLAHKLTMFSPLNFEIKFACIATRKFEDYLTCNLWSTPVKFIFYLNCHFSMEISLGINGIFRLLTPKTLSMCNAVYSTLLFLVSLMSFSKN